MSYELLDELESPEKLENKPKRSIIYILIMLVGFLVKEHYMTPVGMRDIRLLSLYALLNVGVFLVLGIVVETLRYFYRYITKRKQKKYLWFVMIESAFSFWILLVGTLAVLFWVKYIFFPNL